MTPPPIGLFFSIHFFAYIIRKELFQYVSRETVHPTWLTLRHPLLIVFLPIIYTIYICPAPTLHNQPGWFHSNVSRETYLPSLPGCIPSIIYRLYYVLLPPLRRPGRENCLARAANSSPYLATAPLPRLLLLFHAHCGMDVSRET